MTVTVTVTVTSVPVQSYSLKRKGGCWVVHVPVHCILAFNIRVSPTKPSCFQHFVRPEVMAAHCGCT
jgi:hypothetical protein